MSDTKIEWTDVTWNPIRGCSVISPGCVNCYAMKQAHRFSGAGKAYEGLTNQTSAGPQWTGKVMLAENHLSDPLKWRAPKRVFVNSMADLFHESVPDEWIDRIFAVMAMAHQHTFQILTKRADRMRAYVTAASDKWGERMDGIEAWMYELGNEETALSVHEWPLKNVWLGVSVESQKYADERIPLLLKTPAAVRFISAEPLIGPIDFRYGQLSGCDECCNGDRCPGPPECNRRDRRSCHVCKGTARGINLDWVIVGGESGPGARPCHTDWIAEIVRQCAVARVACFVKQLGANGYQLPGGYPLRDRKGADMAEWPDDLRVRQFPEARS